MLINNNTDKIMKAEELMIGDIVLFPHGADKVRDILFVDGKGMCASFSASATLFPIEIERLTPLTITEEHLAQLGFRNAGGSTFILDTTNLCFKCRFTYYIEEKVLHINGGFIPEPICNVHQLQHAMRLCNLKCDITL